MGSRKAHTFLFEGYLVSSQLALVAFVLLSFSGSEPGPNHFFLACIILVNQFFINNLWGWSSRLREERILAPFFLFQFLFLQAYAFEAHLPGALYLALVPAISGVYFLNSPHSYGLRHLRGKGIILLVMGPISFFLFSMLFKSDLVNTGFLITLSAFALWGAGLMSWGDIFKLQTNKKFSGGDERLFVHDLVNQTHGLFLYLNFKATAEEPIEPRESFELINEVKILQSLIKDHFGYEHRNLVDTMEWVNFESFKKSLDKMITSFLPEPLCEVHFRYSGWIDERNDASLRDKCMVHFPSVYRIMVNIVKNMADERTRHAEFSFDYDEKGLTIRTKNKMAALDRNDDLSEGLTRLILNQKNMRVGEGLESIGAICQKLGGQYSFHIADGHWVNVVEIPNIYSSKMVA